MENVNEINKEFFPHLFQFRSTTETTGKINFFIV